MIKVLIIMRVIVFIYLVQFVTALNSYYIIVYIYFDFKCHKRESNGEKPFICYICGDEFIQLIDWKKHRKTHYDNKIFECDKCHKKFVSKPSIRSSNPQ